MDTINKSALLVLHQTNRHANDLVLQTAAGMDASALTAQVSPSHGSVLALLTHILTSEFFFLARSEGKPVSPKGAPDKTLALQEITLALGQVADERLKYLNWVDDEKLLEVVEIPLNGQPFRLARWQLLTQSLIHSAHHRGELSIVMSGLGHPLPDLDPVALFTSQSSQDLPEE